MSVNPSARLRVAFCSDAVPPVADGVTRTLSELVPSLQESGVDFLFLSGMRPSASLSWRDRVHSAPGVSFPLYPSYKLALPVRRALDPVLDGFAPDVIHVVTPSLLGLYGVRYGNRRSIPVAASYHTNFPALFAYYGLGRFEGLGRRYVKWFYNQCSLTLAPSRSLADELRAQGLERVGLWQRGVDLQRFSPAFRAAPPRNAKPVVLFVGRLAREKGVDYLVAAVDMLRRADARFELVMVGEGPMRAELEARLPHARFTGHVRGDELARLYADADIFAFPAPAETFGNVVLEAFASGLPVVGVKRGGVAELVSPGVNGLLACPDTPGSFAGAVRVLLDRPSLRARLGAAARATARDYRWPTVNEGLLECYRELAGVASERARAPRAAARGVIPERAA